VAGEVTGWGSISGFFKINFRDLHSEICTPQSTGWTFEKGSITGVKLVVAIICR